MECWQTHENCAIYLFINSPASWAWNPILVSKTVKEVVMIGSGWNWITIVTDGRLWY
jgi:hypothetical protein